MSYLTSPGPTFAYGFILLLLFAGYIITGSERAKRILGTALTVLIAAIAVVYVYPPFDVPVKDAARKTFIDPKTGREVIAKKGKITLGIDLKGGTTFLIRIQPAEDATTGEK